MASQQNDQLSQILRLTAEFLDIPEELFQKIIQKYKEVGRFLAEPESALASNSPEIYPQGSARLGTMIRPLTDVDEYDIDLVCLLQLKKESITQKEFKKRIGDRLREKSEYCEILAEGRRCWTLSFEKRFHMDVLPAIPDQEGHLESILITDKDLTRWQHSNPIGYANWFWLQMKVAFEEEKRNLAKAMGVDLEDVPNWKVKTTLQRVVQLLKRHRDLNFQNEPESKPVSIIISTLAAQAYSGQANLYDALIHVIRTMPAYIEKRNDEYWVQNPVNERENFADKWKQYPQRKKQFFAWLNKLETDLTGLSETRGIQDLSATLGDCFGSEVVAKAIKNYGDLVHQQRTYGKLFMAEGTGSLGSTGNTPVRKHTFYGEVDKAESD